MDGSNKSEIGLRILSEFEDMEFYSDKITIVRAAKVVRDLLDVEQPTRSKKPSTFELLDKISTNELITLDPVMAAANALLKFYDGKSDSVEFIDVDTDTLDAARKIVSDYRRANRPLISVDFTLAESRQEVIATLERMVTSLKEEKGVRKDLSEEDDTSHHKETFFDFEKCRTHTWNFGAPFWKERPEGRVLLQEVCTTTDCGGGCQYCLTSSNNGWVSVKTGPITSCYDKVVWTNNDRESEPPSGTKIPNFNPIEWDHCLQVFPIGSNNHSLTSRFGWRNLGSKNDFHGGIDVSGPAGTYVLSIENGIVEKVKPYKGPIPGQKVDSGVWVRSGDVVRVYWHIDPWSFLNVGDFVGRGSFLGTIAAWPKPSKNHVHLGIHDTGSHTGLPTDKNAADPLAGCSIFD